MKKILLIIFLYILSGCATLPDHYISLEDRRILLLDQVLQRIENEHVIFIGETHDSARDHLVQIEVIKHLHARGKKVTIALELFPASDQSRLNSWFSGELPMYHLVRKYPYLRDYYTGILEYAWNNRIPVIGLNADRAFVERVSRNGPEGISAASARTYRFTPCSEAPEYESQLRLGRGRGYHASQFPYLCDGQRFRDSVMAYHIAEYLKGNDATMVVLTGVAHASKVAVPRLLQDHMDVRYKVLMPESVRFIIRREPDWGVADYKWQ